MNYHLLRDGSVAGSLCSPTARKFNKDAKITVMRRERRALPTCDIPYIFSWNAP
jgi:hypothetical protein